MRLFTGFPTGDAFLAAASALARSNGRIEGLRWTQAVNLHVTACFIGEVQPGKLPELKKAVGEICGRHQSIHLTFKEICLWPKRKPYMVWALFEENPAFAKIYRELEHSLTGTTGQGPVLPHVTLARFKEYTDIRQIRLTGTAFPEMIPCEKLILFESRLASEGPTYYPLRDYTLGTPMD